MEPGGLVVVDYAVRVPRPELDRISDIQAVMRARLTDIERAVSRVAAAGSSRPPAPGGQGGDRTATENIRWPIYRHVRHFSPAFMPG